MFLLVCSKHVLDVGTQRGGVKGAEVPSAMALAGADTGRGRDAPWGKAANVVVAAMPSASERPELEAQSWM